MACNCSCNVPRSSLIRLNTLLFTREMGRGAERERGEGERNDDDDDGDDDDTLLHRDKNLRKIGLFAKRGM